MADSFPGILCSMRPAVALIPVMCWFGASCGPPATEGGFDSPNPAAKMYAIEQAARDADAAAIPRIIEQLDSDDPAVRLLAITTLKRLTGQTYGYRDYDPPEVRRLAIERWTQAVRSGEISTSPAGPTEHSRNEHAATHH